MNFRGIVFPMGRGRGDLVLRVGKHLRGNHARLDDRLRRGEAGIQLLRGRLLLGRACLRPWFRGIHPFRCPSRRRIAGPLRRCLRRSVGGGGRDDGIRDVGIVDRESGQGRTTRPSRSLRPRDRDLRLGEEEDVAVRCEDHVVGDHGVGDEGEAVHDAMVQQRGSRLRRLGMQAADYDGLRHSLGGFDFE